MCVLPTAGVIKDWLLIVLSAMLFKAPVANSQLVGYFVAFLGVCWYNYQKMQALSAPKTSAAKQPRPVAAQHAAERQPLLSSTTGRV